MFRGLLAFFALWSFATPALSQATQQNSDEELQQEFYRADKVQTLHLDVAASDLQRMKAALPKRVYVPASFRWRDVSLQKVAIRYKGNSSSNPNQKHKRSFLIKFSEYDKKLRFAGLERASLDNGIQFGGLLSEPIVTQILHDLKIPTHRCNYAKLLLNGQFHGVYVNVERIDETFLKSRFPGATGPLFKVDEGGPGCNLQFVGDNPEPYRKTFESKNQAAKKGIDPVIDFIRLVNRPGQQPFSANIDQHLQFDNFLRTTSVMLLSGAFDQLTGWQCHNYYLFLHHGDSRWHYFPWDLDVGFSETAFGRIHVLQDWNAAWPVPTTGTSNPLLERVIADPNLLIRYRTIAKEVLESHFEPNRLCAIIDAKYALFKDDLKNDPFPTKRVTSRANESHDEIVASMKLFVKNRYASAKAQLEQPGERPKFVGRQPGQNGPDGMPPELARKIEAVQRQAKQLQKEMAALQSKMQQVGPLMQQRKFQQAEKLVDEALQLGNETSP